MKTIALLVTVGALHCLPVAAVLHPALVDPMIAGCDSKGPDGPCNTWVFYSAAGTELREITPAAPPLPSGGTTLVALGTHCDYGNSLNGTPVSSCAFRPAVNSDHAPNIENCRLKSTDSWELTDDSTCYLSKSYWGPHTGAGPGGECVLFVQSGGYTAQSAASIFGLVTPDVIATSGNAFCQKPLPPEVTCDITLPPVIDHGVVGLNDHSVMKVEGELNCGATPQVTILGGGNVQLAPGVTARLVTELPKPERLVIKSTLDTVNADPGDHNASVVILVSPY